jgi:hypothetical protein
MINNNFEKLVLLSNRVIDGQDENCPLPQIKSSNLNISPNQTENNSINLIVINLG